MRFFRPAWPANSLKAGSKADSTANVYELNVTRPDKRVRFSPLKGDDVPTVTPILTVGGETMKKAFLFLPS